MKTNITMLRNASGFVRPKTTRSSQPVKATGLLHSLNSSSCQQRLVDNFNQTLKDNESQNERTSEGPLVAMHNEVMALTSDLITGLQASLP